MVNEDYYKLLGVSKSSTQDEIKKAYRQLAIKYHPDKNPDDKAAEEMFKKVTEAYDVLSDPDKRKIYDTYGKDGLSGRGYAGPDFSNFGSFNDIFQHFTNSFGFGGFENIFDIFGSRKKSRTYTEPKSGNDILYRVSINLEDALGEKSVTINYNKRDVCNVCNGKGSADGAQPETCSRCNGSGKLNQAQGFFTVTTPCPHCSGTGKAIKNPCKTCQGSGTVQKVKTINVKIPRGVEEGMRVKLKGEGEAGELGGPAGDLYIEFSFNDHPVYKRRGSDLYITKNIEFPQAALGSDVYVQTLDSKDIKLKIPSGTQNGSQFRLKGHGLPLKIHGHGDLYVRVEIKTPTNLSEKQKKLLEEFANCR